ncbi:MAG TPA: hypothetical protein VJS64_00465 [Pyrinomonadaceae bacterium]|nr:hypothetical protein [Pyrinomonadaceae bacterium]
MPYEDVLQSMLGFVAAHGYAAPELESSPEQGTVAVIVGSGHLNMNPTILSMHLARSTEGCSVRIRAVAKEGLVPQHSAQKLVRRVEDALKQ